MVFFEEVPEFGGLQGVGRAVGPDAVTEAAGDLALQGDALIHRDVFGLDDRGPGGPQVQGLLDVALQVLRQPFGVHVHRDFFDCSAHNAP